MRRIRSASHYAEIDEPALHVDRAGSYYSFPAPFKREHKGKTSTAIGLISLDSAGTIFPTQEIDEHLGQSVKATERAARLAVSRAASGMNRSIAACSASTVGSASSRTAAPAATARSARRSCSSAIFGCGRNTVGTPASMSS